LFFRAGNSTKKKVHATNTTATKFPSQILHKIATVDSFGVGANMSKRPAEDYENGAAPLKGGERQNKADLGDEVGEFEDEFEDEYESEDDIIEAGVDGRPDAEREAEEKAGKDIYSYQELPAHSSSYTKILWQMQWM
jgi:hypothetical protein